MATTEYIRYPSSNAGTGTVTSVSLSLPASVFTVTGSPITVSGTLTGSFANQNANTVFAGPTSGGPGTPAFRALVSADIPALGYVTSVTASSPLFSSGGQTPNLTIQVATTAQNGYLSSTDWNTFNNKQPAGSYITALTGDATASGPGSAALTLATVNGNVGTFGTASQVGTFTVNAKGLVTAASNTSVQIAESQVTNLVSDLAGKQPTGNYITALTGDVTASGPGSAAASLTATTNSTITTLSALSLPTSQLSGQVSLTTQVSGTLPIGNGGTGQTSFASGALSSNGTTLTSGTLSVGNGGTGASSLTLNNVILGNGTSPVQFVAPGTSGNVLTSNGTTWQSTAPAVASAVVFSAGLTTNYSVSANAILIYDTVIFDTASGYSTGTGLYTIPNTGYYLVQVVCADTGNTGNLYVVVNGTAKNYIGQFNSNQGPNAASGVILSMSSGDTLGIYSDSAVVAAGVASPRFSNTFSVMQIH